MRQYCKRETIFEQGLPGDAMYILLEVRPRCLCVCVPCVCGCLSGAAARRQGAVDIWRAGHVKPIHRFASVDERPWFGELALWTRSARSASARCSPDTACKVLVLEQEHFATFLAVVPLFREMLTTAKTAYQRLDILASQELRAVAAPDSLDPLVRGLIDEKQPRSRQVLRDGKTATGRHRRRGGFGAALPTIQQR